MSLKRFQKWEKRHVPSQLSKNDQTEIKGLCRQSFLKLTKTILLGILWVAVVKYKTEDTEISK